MTAAPTFPKSLRNPGRAAETQRARRRRIAVLLARGDDRQAAEMVRIYEVVEAAFRAVGRCSECGIPLREETAVARGIGPDCWDALQADADHERVVRGLAEQLARRRGL